MRAARSSPTAACRRSRSSPTCCSQPGAHAVVMRQVYNKTRTFLEWSAKRVGATITLVDDGDLAALAAALRPETAVRVRRDVHQPADPRAGRAGARRARARVPGARLVLDTTIASPWAFARAAARAAASHVVVGSRDQGARRPGHRARRLHRDERRRARQPDHGPDRDARRHPRRRARPPRRRRTSPLAERAPRAPLRDRRAGRRVPRGASAGRARVPSVAARSSRRRGDRARLRAHRLAARVPRPGADEAAHGALADVLVSTGVPRYALSFDGLATKVNHHKTVSEYFTPPDVVKRLGIDRLIRLGIGLEDADDLIACLNWTLQPTCSPGASIARRIPARDAGSVARARRADPDGPLREALADLQAPRRSEAPEVSALPREGHVRRVRTRTARRLRRWCWYAESSHRTRARSRFTAPMFADAHEAREGPAARRECRAS